MTPAPDQKIAMIKVQVVCAFRDIQVLRDIQIRSGACIADAVRESAVLVEFSDLDRDSLSYAVFGKYAPPSQCLRNGDRVEILRPLLVDPREARRRRAKSRN
jgi:putative ubiquitin-RnfH superfamily antitoxin RatB of RatAB toxin-antitoxin module